MFDLLFQFSTTSVLMELSPVVGTFTSPPSCGLRSLFYSLFCTTDWSMRLKQVTPELWTVSSNHECESFKCLGCYCPLCTYPRTTFFSTLRWVRWIRGSCTGGKRWKGRGVPVDWRMLNKVCGRKDGHWREELGRDSVRPTLFVPIKSYKFSEKENRVVRC